MPSPEMSPCGGPSTTVVGADHHGDDRIGQGQADGHQYGTQHHAQADESIGARVMVGSYRVIYQLTDADQTVRVASIHHRSIAYGSGPR
jgi:hypothetical protein